MKLVEVITSPNPEKKWRAVFESDTGRRKHTDFGAAKMNDYTITGDKEARARYRERHAKDLKTNDPTRAGFLSYYLLWGESKNKRSNLAAYKREFGV
jgi:hypothetical protein